MTRVGTGFALVLMSAFFVNFTAACKTSSTGSVPLADPSQGATGATPKGQFLITGGTVVSMDQASRVIENGAVAVENDQIVAVGSASDLEKRYASSIRIDATGMVVMPGLVNAHTHVPMTLLRGIADDLPLDTWLQRYIFPAEGKNVDEEFVRWGTKLALAELIRGGVTTYADMYYFEDAVADETAKAGVRAVLGETVIDFPVPDNKTWAEAIAYVERYAAKWKNHPLITPAIAPHAPYTVSEEHLKESTAVAKRLGIPLLIHLSETEKEVRDIRKAHSATPIAYLDRAGVLGAHVLAAHVVWPERSEIPLLAKHGVGVAHCPQSNMKLASGVAPLKALLDTGVAVGLGTDGPASNNDLNMWEEMDTVAKLHKAVSKDPTMISATQALGMATRGGARALKLESKVGSLEAGKKADLIMVGMGAAHQQPIYDVTSHLVYATKAGDVDSVMIDGQFVMRGKRLLTLDEAAIFAKSKQLRDKIRASLATK